MVAQAVDRNGEEPGFELARGIQAVGGSVEVQENVLGQILGELVVMHLTMDEGVHLVEMTIKERAQRFGVALLEGLHEGRTP